MKSQGGERLRNSMQPHFCVHYTRVREARDCTAPAGETRCFSCPYESGEDAAGKCPDYKPAQAQRG